MKKTIILLVLATVIVFIGGCSFNFEASTETNVNEQEDVLEMQTYTNDQYSFSIDYPTDWEKTEGELGAVVSFLSPELEGDDFQESYNIMYEEISGPHATFYNYVQAAKEQIKGIIDITDYIKQDSDASLGGENAYRFSYAGTIPGVPGPELHWVQYVTVLNHQKAYALTFTTSEEDFADQEEFFNQVVETFKFIE